jgi:hypothetical protein
MCRSAFIIVFVMLVSFGGASGVVTLADTEIEAYKPTTYFGGAQGHPGEICVACHTRFSKDRSYANELPYNVSLNSILHIFPCSKPACHRTPPTKFVPIGTTRWTIHMRICEDCHPQWETPIKTVHNTHSNFTPWPPDVEIKGGVIRPDWKGDCSFCHYTIKGALRVHDVHEPVLLKACPICHSTYILQSKSMFERINYPYPFEEEKSPTLEDTLISIVSANRSVDAPIKTPPPSIIIDPFLSEFYIYFDAILEELLNIFTFVV